MNDKAARPAIAFHAIDPARCPDIEANDVWPELRARSPVTWCENPDGGDGDGFWVVARHRDVVTAYRNTAQLSSQRGNMLRTLRTEDPAAGQMMVVTDPPRHGELRRIIQDAFSPRAMAGIADALRKATSELVAAALERGGGDFVADIAAQVPLISICELLAVPDGDRQRMLELTMATFGGGPYSFVARAEVLRYYSDLIAERRKAPGEDVVSLLATREIDGVPLTDTEVIYNCYNIIIGGDETTRFAAAGGLLALMRNPEQWELLKANPDLVDGAVEEILRWTTPATHMCRMATSALTLGGVEIAPDEVVTLWNVSANRDEEVFDAPYRFDIARTPNRHLTLGHGPHFCIGGGLTRVELRILLEELLARVDSVSLAGEVEYATADFITGVSRLPVVLTA